MKILSIIQRNLLNILLAIFFIGGIGWWWGSHYLTSREKQRERNIAVDAKQLGLAAIEYQQDHHEHFPDAGRWEQEITPYIGSTAAMVLHPPAPLFGTPRRFAFNRALSGKWIGALKSLSNTPMFFESVARTASASDNLESLPSAKDGGQRFAVVYADGHCYTQPQEWKQFAKEHPDEAGGTILGNGLMN